MLKILLNFEGYRGVDLRWGLLWHRLAVVKRLSDLWLLVGWSNEVLLRHFLQRLLAREYIDRWATFRYLGILIIWILLEIDTFTQSLRSLPYDTVSHLTSHLERFSLPLSLPFFVAGCNLLIILVLHQLFIPQFSALCEIKFYFSELAFLRPFELYLLL